MVLATIFQILEISLATAWAIPIPPSATLPPLQLDWAQVSIQVDLRNLVGPGDAGRFTDAELASRISATNDIWAQCSIRFVARSAINVRAVDIGTVYEPKNEDELQKIGVGLFPNGYRGTAIPLMFAGPWNWYDPRTGLYLKGLGWLFTGGDGSVTRVGAFLGNQHLFEPVGGTLIAHELGHALSLPDGAPQDNLMGGGSPPRLTPSQCNQARQTAQTVLKDFLVRVPGQS